MTQIHKKFSGDQIKVLLSSYEQGNIGREEIENTLGISKTRFFALLKEFRKEPEFLFDRIPTPHSREAGK